MLVWYRWSRNYKEMKAKQMQVASQTTHRLQHTWNLQNITYEENSGLFNIVIHDCDAPLKTTKQKQTKKQENLSFT